jgi:hypothetical protein
MFQINRPAAWLLAAALSAAATAAQPAAAPVSVKADGLGGLAGLSQEEVDALREVREMLKQAAGDPREHLDDQRRALLALVRVHEALNDWGLEGQLDWCLRAIKDAKRNGDVLAALAIAAAKGGADHLGGVRGLWDRLEIDSGDKTATAAEWRKRQVLFDRLCREMPKHAPRAADVVRPMRLEVKKIDFPTLRASKLAPKIIDLKSAISPYK